jgi:HK97 family phage prohead protease
MSRATVQVDELEIREGDGGAVTIAGRAAPFGQWSQELRTRNRRFRERIAPTAFDRALTGGGDVLALWQHDPAMPLARTRANTLRLWKDETGLRFEMTPAVDTPWGLGAVAAVRAGLVDAMSFGFRVSAAGMTAVRGANDVYEHTLHDVDLREISLVTFPAYPGTAAMVRSGTEGDEQIEANDDEHVIDGGGQESERSDTDSIAADASRRARLATMMNTDLELATRRRCRIGETQ